MVVLYPRASCAVHVDANVITVGMIVLVKYSLDELELLIDKQEKELPWQP